MKKHIMKVILFFMILFAVIGGSSYILSPKPDPVYQEKKNSIDVMFFGSSMCYCTFDVPLLWQEFGIPSYNMGKQQQLPSLTYYTMKDILADQHPKVIVLELYGFSYPTDNPEVVGPGLTGASLDIMRMSQCKTEAIQANVPDQSKWIEYQIPFIRTHSNWKSLSLSSFTGIDSLNYKGFASYFKGVPSQKPNQSVLNDEQQKMGSAKKEYLYKIIALAKQENIPLVFVKAPYPIRTDIVEMTNTVKEIAHQNQIPFIDYTRKFDELNFDFTQDTRDGQHLSSLGAEKVTRDLGKYLQTTYHLENKKGQDAYKTWESVTQQYYNTRAHDVKTK